MRSRAARALVTTVAIALGAAAHPAASQTRDAGANAAGTATLTGTVVADDSGRPVGRALVTVKGVAPAFAEVASTDAQGRFVISGLAAGDVTVTATKTTYLTAFYGGRDAIRGPAVPFTLSNGAARDITLRLVRGAVIDGTVNGSTGRPQAGVQVTARQSRVAGGTRRLVGGLRGQGGPTDDQGRYRIWGLPPGEYVVEATPADDFTEARATSDADVQWATAVAGGARSAAPAESRLVRFAPVYYPGAIDAAQAAVVPLGAGDERDGVDIALQAIATADLRGAVVGTDGQPAADVMVSLDGALEHETTSTDRDGRFAFRGVAPGAHTLSARGPHRRGAAARATVDTPWGSLDVVVNGQDQSDLTIALRPGMTVTGRVRFDGQPSGAKSQDAVIVLVPTSDAGAAQQTQTNDAADGTFALAGLAPGTYRVSAAAPGSGRWIAKSVLYQGQDLLDGTLDVVPGEDISDVTVVFSDRPTALGGTLLDSAGHPVAGYEVVVFAADRRFWTPDSRRVVHATLGRDGHFDFSNLPAGDYLIAAVTHADDDDLADPDWLGSVAPMALHLALADGERKVQDLRLGK